jgi:acetyl esterase/lipase
VSPDFGHGFLPRIGSDNHLAIDRCVGPSSLWHDALDLPWAVVDAAWAEAHPEELNGLRAHGTHLLADSAGWRYRPNCATLPQTAPDDAPPLFLLAATDDHLGVEYLLELYSAWRAGGRPADLHLFAWGCHGFGTLVPHLPVGTWPQLLTEWLRVLDVQRAARGE